MLVNTLVTICIISFAALFIVVVYFRIKVLKAYGILFRNRVEFDIAHIFHAKKMREEIISKYPKFEKELIDFSLGIRLSTTMVTVFMVIISLCGAILMYYR